MVNALRWSLMLLVLALTACADDPPGDATSSSTGRRDLGGLVYRSVDLLLAGASSVAADTPIIVASISDTENVEASSPLGNIVAELIRTRLAQDGHQASEIRLRRSVSFGRGEGEFLLSRNRQALLPPHFAAAMVTGTYAAGYEMVYVSLKLVSAADGHIISGADFEVSLDQVGGLLPRKAS
jgi:hypothetical protein